jgi:hypothetical protein
MASTISRVIFTSRGPIRGTDINIFYFSLEALIDLARDNAVEITRNGSNVGRDGHFVVVENDQQFLLQMPGLIDTLECDTTGQPTVANDGHDTEVFLRQVACHRHAQCR